ncbi:hypothetical protein E2C01_065642 [Portunus trituberculatus]|uniref:Uncharacterized protein n=1 Tax=Portunus trituberculatus TaxID=210409 RepID=A0A5B7HNY4_PORTR|nr:hypothetical protein [Portunus trituberculatus]
MTATSKWARKHWEQTIKNKLTGPGVSEKTWWALGKERQGLMQQDSVPPPHSLGRMDPLPQASPTWPPPVLPRETAHTELMEKELGELDVKKAMSPDEISP